MKAIYPNVLSLLVLFACFTGTSLAQWSEPKILFPGYAYPDQFAEESLYSPVISSIKGPDGAINLIWSNREGNQVNLVHSKKCNGVWTPVVKIADCSLISMEPTAVFDSSGTLHCAWISVDEDDTFTVYYSRLFLGHEWETPVKVSDLAYLLNAHPRLLIDDQGNIRLFYNAAVKVGNMVFFYIKHYIIDQNNQIISTIQQPAPGSSSQFAFNPYFISDNNGRIHCFWYDHNGNSYNLLTSIFDGFEWNSATILASSGSGSYLYDEMPIVTGENKTEDIIALWLSLDPESAQYRKYVNNSGWGDLANVGNGTFRNANGLLDGQNYFHIVGNEDSYRGGHLYHHVLVDDHWQHILVEAGTNLSMPGFSSLVLKNDTLFCYYVRFSINGNELVERYSVLDHLTPVNDKLPLSDFVPTIFPNPVSENSILRFHSFGSGPVYVKLYNISGMELKREIVQGSAETVTIIKINKLFDNLVPGIYLLRICNQNLDKTLKVFVH